MEKTIKRIVPFKNHREYWDFRTEYLNEHYVPSNKDENLPLYNIFGIIYEIIGIFIYHFNVLLQDAQKLLG